MALAPVQKASKEVATSPNILAYGSNVGGTGSILSAYAYVNSNTATLSISDSRTNAWTPCGTIQRGIGGLSAWSFQMFVALTPSAGATTVTATASAGTPDIGLAIEEYNGFIGVPLLTGTPAYASPNGVAPATPGITTTIPTALILAACFPGSNVSAMAAPFINRNAPNDGNWGAGTYGYDAVTSPQGGLTASWTVALNDNIVGIVGIGDQSSIVPADLSLGMIQSIVHGRFA